MEIVGIGVSLTTVIKLRLDVEGGVPANASADEPVRDSKRASQVSKVTQRD